MVVAAAESEVLLRPDDLCAQLEAASSKPGSDDIAVQRPEPYIGGVSGKQGIGLLPVGAIVVEHLAPCQLASAEAAARSPARVVADAVRRIGDQQRRFESGQHQCDIGRVGTVAAADS